MSDTPRAPSQTDIAGTVLNNKYQVLQRLSQGGMGVVYKARHLNLDTLVALKVLLKPEEREAQERFISEARLASKIRHPNTVYIADFGMLPDGRAFLEMEFLDGRTLGAEIQKGRIDVLRACRIAMGIARGLQAVHDKGIIHRDMKPDNVFLLSQDGTTDFVKIVDFGIAKIAPRADTPAESDKAITGPVDIGAGALAALDSEGAPKGHTLPGSVMGTPGFMAPEQMQALKLDVRVDQYALGCILYEMLAGQPVFEAQNSMALMMKHLTGQPRPLRKRLQSPEIPESLDALVLKLLAKEPSGRFASMREVEQALQREIDLLLVQRGEKPGTTDRVGALARLRRRVPLWLMLPSLSVLLVGLGYGAFRLLGRRPDATFGMQSRELAALRARALDVVRRNLGSGPPELRRSALFALGQTRDATLRPEVEAALASREPELRAAAAAALGALGDRRAIPVLAAILAGGGNQEPQVTAQAAAALRQLGDPRGQRFLDQTLESQDPDSQLRAALLFCDQGSPNVGRVLRGYLARPTLPLPTQLNILACLGRGGDTTALDRLRTLVVEVGPADTRIAAAVRLAQAGDAEGLKFLREVARKRGAEQLLAARELSLLDENDGLDLFRGLLGNRGGASLARQLACEGLGAVGEPADARLLDQVLDEKGDVALEQAAARGVLQIAGRDPGLLTAQSLAWASTALGDSDSLIRRSAADILGDSASAGAVSLLAGLLADRDVQVRRSAAVALGKQRAAAAAAALGRALADSDAGVRLEALRALLRIGGALRGPALATATNDLRAALAALVKQAGSSLEERVLTASVLLQLGDSGQLARLRDWLFSPKSEAAGQPEIRRLALSGLSLPADELAPLLSDAAPAVRFLAARKLGELGDRRAIPVLREMTEHGGPEAVQANGLLTRLGEAPAEPEPVLALLAESDPAKRIAGVEALAENPPARAQEFLARAARDRDPLVRSKVVEVAGSLAERPGGEAAVAILQRLAGDSDSSVRARAAALLARRRPAPKESATAASAGTASPHSAEGDSTPTPAADHPPDGGAAPIPGAGSGVMIVEGPPGVQFQIDKRPWQAVSERPITVEAGPHTVNFLSGQKQVTVTAGQTVRVQIATSQIEQLARGGLDSFDKGDLKKAQRQLEKAVGLCSRDRQHAALCTSLTFDLIYRLGQIHEGQKEWPEAMFEYQRGLAMAPQVRGKNDVKAGTQAAVARLAPRLGQVIVPKRTKRGCQEDTIWMPPGTHSIRVDSKFQEIEVKARGVVRVGTCGP